MKKRIFSLVLALSLLLAPAVPVLAAVEPEPSPEPEYRLVGVTATYGGSTSYTFVYGQGGYLPTEVSDGFSGTTASYDEGGRITSYQDAVGTSYTRVYDGDGNLSEETGTNTTFDEANNEITGETHTTYAYDANGNRLTAAEESVWDNGSTTSGSTEYAYDEKGNCVREEHTYIGIDGSEHSYTYTYKYTFDDQGRIAAKTTAYNNNDPGSAHEYIYDEEGKLVGTTWDSGKDYYMPLLRGTWLGGDFSSFTLYLVDATESVIFYWACRADSEPMLTYDDNGYLVRVDGTEGSSIELTYEPVA